MIIDNIFYEVGSGLLFVKEILRTAIKSPWDRKLLLTQIYNVTMQSLLTTASSGFFVGAILAVQFNVQLKEFDSLSVLGGLATSGTIRELGPLLIAFMLSGKVGAYTSAELGTMRVTEQIDAMRCLGVNPIEFLIVPRFMGIIISSFILLFAGLLMSIVGGIVFGSLVGHLNPQEYLSTIPQFVTGSSILGGLVKCLTFSFLLASICTYKGYTTTGGAKGVGLTVIATSLSTMVGIVLVDWLTSFLGHSLGVLFYG
jgi:phospholipid/cholesterol/gamma-HCH transport system permease protein